MSNIAGINYNTDSEGDIYYTPSRYIKPLFQIIDKSNLIFDPASGAGNIINPFLEEGYRAIGSDITEGKDFLSTLFPLPEFDIIVTNPPFSKKNEFLKRALEIGKPFCFYLPSSSIETRERIELITQNNLQIISFGERTSFIKINGQVDDRPASECFWFCYKMNLSRDINYIKLNKISNEEKLNQAKRDYIKYSLGSFDLRVVK